MAKQIGIHQIKGKVEGRSYYRQTGVENGLSRAINPAMSNRVKTGEEYANTRLNNAEFGQACMIAGQLGRMVSPKFRPMVLPFSQAIIAKSLLKEIKDDPTANAQWGYRGLQSVGFSVPVEGLNSTAKVNFADYISELTISAASAGTHRETWTITTEWQEGVIDKLLSLGATGVSVRFLGWDGIYKRPNSSDQTPASFRVKPCGNTSESEESPSGDMETELSVSTPATLPATTVWGRVLVVVVMPYRTIGGTEHILQEACTFKAFDVQAPE